MFVGTNIIARNRMVSFPQVPAATARFILLHFTHMEEGNVLAAVLCLALAHRAKIACGKLQQTSVGVMGVVTVEHGNTGRTIAERRANEWRDRRASLMKLYTLGPKAFKRRFKMTRPLFDDLVDIIKPIVEVDDRGKEMADTSNMRDD